MEFGLTEEQTAIRTMVREFAEREIAPVSQDLDEREEFPWEIVRKLADLGLMGTFSLRAGKPINSLFNEFVTLGTSTECAKLQSMLAAEKRGRQR